MLNRTFSAYHVLAAVLWVVSAAIIIWAVTAGVEGGAGIGLWIALAAGTLNVRGTLRHMEERQMQREHNAFELGRQVAGSRPVRGLH